VKKYDKHKQLKKKAMKILEEDYDMAVYEEVTIRYPGMPKGIRVDVVGYGQNCFGQQYNIAAECGKVSKERIAELCLYFDLVLHFPYEGEPREWNGFRRFVKKNPEIFHLFYESKEFRKELIKALGKGKIYFRPGYVGSWYA